MDTSIILARIMGPMMLVMGASLLVNGRAIRALAKDFLNSHALIYLAGFITLLLGLIVVVFHNVWVAGWPVIITIFGWIMVAAGIARMNMPDRLKKLGGKMISNTEFMTGAAILYIALGAVLTYFGYLAGVQLPGVSQ